jgi:hypothetical protein
LVLAGGRKPHMRKASRRNWTRAKEREFLSVLAETCNVLEAARQARVCASYAYKKRAADARFRAGWIAAIGAAYQRLELVLLDRAFNGTEKVVKRRDGSEERMLEYSNQLGLALLKMHGDTAVEAETEFTAESADEIRERLIKKLRRLKARNDAKDKADQCGDGATTDGVAGQCERRTAAEGLS